MNVDTAPHNSGCIPRLSRYLDIHGNQLDNPPEAHIDKLNTEDIRDEVLLFGPVKVAKLYRLWIDCTGTEDWLEPR